ncbi:RNA-binding protein 48 [Denticeps clupeoides]|uniref:RNA-binding protein 48 n=1 Tax=Denticeps clupeoides TaxID=299321 RepID=A0AAY4EIL9_9TELE|nr:RNA-binding protein 48 [Denticeps clupeoides]
MAAPAGNSVWDAPTVYKHHEQQRVCDSRPKYREGRRPKAVKVYTVNLESRFVLVQGVPAIGVMEELVRLAALYGPVEEYRALDEYPAERFTEVYLLKFQKVASARAAKRNIDEKSFYGGLLHVCYAPEYESLEDTRTKLQDRRRYVRWIVRREGGRRCKDGGGRVSPETADATGGGGEEPPAEGGGSATPACLGFPVLPPPPREETTDGRLRPEAFRAGPLPPEDKMGSLHHADAHPPPTAPGQSSQHRSNGDKTSPAVRFLPRTAQLRSRKRRVEGTDRDSLLGIGAKNQPVIGPMLPELPKVDMADASLNTTADFIRTKMQRVISVPESQPEEKKAVKPRRRI